jgi:hypothetical protein
MSRSWYVEGPPSAAWIFLRGGDVGWWPLNIIATAAVKPVDRVPRSAGGSTRDFPGSEIAVGMQLKHVTTRALANRVTSSYMNNEASWARGLVSSKLSSPSAASIASPNCSTPTPTAVTSASAPGADRMREAFCAVRAQAEQLRATGQARRVDIRVEHDLLRRTRISIRFGKLNHCTTNDEDPIGAKCLEGAIIPDGHRGPPARPLPAQPLPQRHHRRRTHPNLDRRAVLPAPAAGHRTVAPNHQRSIEAQLMEVDRVLDRSSQ